MDKVNNERRYFRVARKVIVKILALLNEDHTVEDIGVSKEDNEFLVSYSFNDGPKDAHEQEDFGISHNHMVIVSPFALSEFIEILEKDLIVGGIYVGSDHKDEIMVAYNHGDYEKRKQNSGGRDNG